ENGAMRAPDAAWMSNERWQSLTKEERLKFPPICPEFVIELKSYTDSISSLQKKMLEWIDNGCQLAWLIDPEREKVYSYDAEGNIAVVESFDLYVSGEPILPNFKLELQSLRVD
ncbi:MAG: Uma2 family endonuclease, partial [Flammeovirgaceae bacterium]